jgi:hypothetical protein
MLHKVSNAKELRPLSFSGANGTGARPKKAFINDSGGLVAPQTPGSVEATQRFR